MTQYTTLRFLLATSESDSSITFLLIGLAIVLGTLGGRLFYRLRIPKVVGYMAIGVLVGRSMLMLIGDNEIQGLKPFSLFALSLIGFKIGGELRKDVLIKHGKRFLVILVAEALGAFVLTATAIGGIAYALEGDLAFSVSLGIVLGSIAAATGPASMVEVLRECKARGILTTTALAVVALDVSLALILFSVANSIASSLLGKDNGSLAATIGTTLLSLLASLSLGVGVGVMLNLILIRVHDAANMLAPVVGSIILVSGVAQWLEVDLILATMALGLTLANRAPNKSTLAFGTVERFVSPVYVLFFVLVGAQLDMAAMPSRAWLYALTYLFFRIAGKLMGAHLGARLSGAPPAVRDNLGLCLLSQAGIAVGLAILASHNLPVPIGDTVLLVVSASTFFVQLIGPASVKWAVTRAGEAGLNVTEEELIASYKVADVMFSPDMAIPQQARLNEILARFSNSEYLSYPVVDPEGKLVGTLDIDHLKITFGADGLDSLLVAYDIMAPAYTRITAQAPLQQALLRMKENRIDHMPVVANKEDDTIVGYLELRAVNRAITNELLRRQKSAEATS